ncbi:FHA domain-containing protein [Acidovorax sp. SDU_ACID1]|uniref:FHA domain-containing protein n=1 Tax=Acidovorax sp. SDU_ACID1 TaxID=3136632 RepID=UPI0038730D2B
MPRLVVSIDGVVIKEAPLVKEHTAVGRRPYNDVVIDNLAVSGEHAVFHLAGGEAEVEDLNSTNGTYVNGKAVKRQALRSGDTVEVGKYKIRFLSEEEAPGFEKTMLFKPGTLAPQKHVAATSAPVVLSAAVRVLSGPAAGREVALLKVVTTIGKPGVAVASITKRHQGFVLAHVEGAEFPLLNGNALGGEPVVLQSGDRIALAGTEMEFVQG